MIKYKKGDLLKADVDIICHGCNTLGIMGGGIAKSIRDKYPNTYKDYKEQLLECCLGENIYSIEKDYLIVNMLTQPTISNSQKVVSYQAILKCFTNLNIDLYRFENSTYFPRFKKKLGAKRIGIPKIGAGLGGGKWEVISELINEVVEESNLDVTVYEL